MRARDRPHTGSDARNNLPRIRCDLDDERTRRYAVAFGAPFVLHSRLRDGSLRAAATQKGIRVLLYEAGEAFRFDPRAIRIGVEGIFRVMRTLGMVGAKVRPSPRPAISKQSAWVRAPRSGFCKLHVRLGARVRAGEKLAEVFDALDFEGAVLKAPTGGIVVGVLESALVSRGNAVVHVAEIE